MNWTVWHWLQWSTVSYQLVLKGHLFIRNCHILLLKFTKSPREPSGSKECQFTITSILMSSPWLAVLLRHPLWLCLHSTGNHHIIREHFHLSFSVGSVRSFLHFWGETLAASNPDSNFAGWRLKPKPILRWRDMLTHFLPFQPLLCQVLSQDQ